MSRAVHEQVANKLSVQFADIGAQEVKNIPTPVHAYMVAMRREDGTYATPQVKKPRQPEPAATPNWMWPAAVTLVLSRRDRRRRLSRISPSSRASVPSRRRQRPATLQARRPPVARLRRTIAAACTDVAAPAPHAAPQRRHRRSVRRSPRARSLRPTTVPFVGDRARSRAGERICASRPTTRRSPSTSCGINALRHRVSRAKKQRKSAARRAVPEARGRRSSRRANARSTPSATRVVYPHGKPPVPPTALDQARSTRPKGRLSAKEVPLVRDAGRTRLENGYTAGAQNQGDRARSGRRQFFFNTGRGLR